MKALLFIYALGTLTDYWTTAWAIPRGATECNPMMAALIANHGIVYVLYAKIVVVGIVCLMLWLMYEFDREWTEAMGEPCRTGHRVAFGMMWLVALAQWLICANNFWWMRIAMALGL